jgi:hypothetical protein
VTSPMVSCLIVPLRLCVSVFASALMRQHNGHWRVATSGQEFQ